MEAYINGISCISAQNHTGDHCFPETVIRPTGVCFQAIEPSYKELIAPNLLRRMGRAIKMGVSAASTCLKDAGLKEADAIVSGTGLGCFEDSEKFLLALIDNKEQFLTPTSFIQSTHNTVGAQVALILKCHQYNMTYVHRAFSFETALLDALMLLDEGEGKNILAGGIDELTPGYSTLMARAGYLKSRPFAGGTLNTEKTPGTYMGEGAAFFVLSHEKTETSYARLRGVCFLSKPDLAELENTLTAFLSSKGLVVSDLSLVMLGNSGDVRFENILETLSTGFFKETAQANFKHLCGEYMTSGSFALWLASTILKGQVPGMLEQIRTNQLPVGPMKHILVVNHFRNMEYSFMLISAC